MDNGYFSGYANFNGFNIITNPIEVDERMSRNFEELISERGSENEIIHEKKMYTEIFDNIKEKLFLSSETNDVELIESDKERFRLKYNITETNKMIYKLKKEISTFYVRKTENELLIQERKRLFDNFCDYISQSIQSINDITRENFTEDDAKLKELLNDRIDWYYKELDLENLVNEDCNINLEFHFLKESIKEILSLNPTVCVVCMENSVSWFIDPCGHTLCNGCKTKMSELNNCHYCRCKRIKYNRLYL